MPVCRLRRCQSIHSISLPYANAGPAAPAMRGVVGGWKKERTVCRPARVRSRAPDPSPGSRSGNDATSTLVGFVIPIHDHLPVHTCTVP